MIWILVAVGVVLSLAALRFVSADVYDIIIVHMTKRWYEVVLERMQPKSSILDVGIGTATALLKNKSLVQSKELKIVGVDYDQSYINAAEKKVMEEGLQDKIKLHCKSVFDEDLGKVIEKTLPMQMDSANFDAIYFSGSWSLMPSPVEALRVAAKLLKEDGLIYITQTFQKQPSPILSFIKPLLKYFITIDFGRLHLVKDLDSYLKSAEEDENGIKFNVIEKQIIPGSINNSLQAAYIIVLKKVVTVEQPTQRR